MDAREADAFWAEMSPCEHFVQIYEADSAFMDTLSGFISGGLTAGQAAVVIMTEPHRTELDRRLMALGLDVDDFYANDQFISLDAEETLAGFMENGWPDDNLFAAVITQILQRARGKNDRKVRAFGEMVALLWAQGQTAATVRLEHLWHRLCRQELFCLFCAYPKVGFTENPSESIERVCATHSKVLAA
jgi:hypothetical protein